MRLFQLVRKRIGRGANWNDEWAEEKELLVRVLCRRMVAAEWLIGEEDLVIKKKVAGRASTMFALCSKHTIAPELCEIQLCSSYLCSVKCNLDKNTNAWVCAHCKLLTQKVKPVPLSDGSTPEGGLEWRGRDIPRPVAIPGHWDERWIPKFSHRARGRRLTLERWREQQIKRILKIKEMEALLGML